MLHCTWEHLYLGDRAVGRNEVTDYGSRREPALPRCATVQSAGFGRLLAVLEETGLRKQRAEWELQGHLWT